jgi:hypothetical protein
MDGFFINILDAVNRMRHFPRATRGVAWNKRARPCPCLALAPSDNILLELHAHSRNMHTNHRSSRVARRGAVSQIDNGTEHLREIKQNKTKQNKTIQNKTKQNKQTNKQTNKQNKTKQNKRTTCS